MKDWKTIANGVLLTVAFSSTGKAMAQTFNKVDDLASRVKKEVKFTIPEITKGDNLASWEVIAEPESAQEVLQPREIKTANHGTIEKPYISDMNIDMPNGNTGHMYLYQGMINGKETVFAARFVDGDNNAWAVNKYMSPDLVYHITKAVENNNDAEVLKLANQIKEVQAHSKITDSRYVIDSFEKHYTIKDNRIHGMSYAQQRKLCEWSPKQNNSAALLSQNQIVK